MSRKSRCSLAEWKSCRSKKTFNTVPEAGAYAGHIWLNMKQMNWTYECKFCGKYHLTQSRKEAV